MADPEVVVLPDADAVAKAAAKRFAQVTTTAVRDRGLASVALSGGSTPLAMFHLLASPLYQTNLPWDDIHIFWADERLVPPESPGSNYGQAEMALLCHVPLPAANIHRMRGEWPAGKALADYTAQLARFAEQTGDQPAAWPRMDLVLLGLGSDGHTASLFPGSPVATDLSVLPAHADYDGRPAERLTLTPPVLNAARQVIFLVTGASKAEAVAATLGDECDPLHWPAQRIQPESGTRVWLMDEAAAEKLPS
ncbi:MAG: 6-phosphogluconolactonase [Chloroflexota bacterium]